MVFGMTPEEFAALLAFLTPLIGLIITWIKKQIGEEQGDMGFTALQGWIDEAQNLAIYFPEVQPIVNELAETVNHARELWKSPNDNSAELAQVYAHARELVNQIYSIILKYAPPQTMNEQPTVRPPSCAKTLNKY